ncbi:MAG: MATE family efflux transporter [Spirochaetales bacterium]|nr:MATE family efflux transporter [Spirochaetales bacterium]
MATQTRLMTSGPIRKHLLLFAFPIFLGGLLQQLYHTTDAVVVGNFVSSQALAAVSSVGALTMLIVGLFQGVAVGAGVVISTAFGKGDYDSVRKAVHTTVALGLISSILLTIIGYTFTPTILLWMKTPPEVFVDAQAYIRIFFLGVSSLVMYNVATGILQAVGDSKNPLYFLIISTILNIVLDLVFVIGLKMGIEGTAYATIIAQSVSAILSFRLLFRTKEIVRIRIGEVRIHRGYLGRALRLGVPSGIQNSVTSFANVIVQSSINLFGPAAMAAHGSYNRIQGFAFIPITAFALALMTFTGQNLGAGKKDRVREAARFGMFFAMALAQLVGFALMLFGGQVMTIFTRDSEIIRLGVQKGLIAGWFFWALALSHTMSGILRGAGKSVVPMTVMLSIWCVLRIIFIKVGLALFFDIRIVFWAHPATWTISSIIFVIYYFSADWMGRGDG